MREPMLVVENLVKHFPIGRGSAVYAVDDISFTINRGETLGLVGESGCGKTTAGRTILRLIKADSGKVMLDGIDVLGLSDVKMHEIRKRMQIIFQDPFNSLDPRKTVLQLIGEPLQIHHTGKKAEIQERVLELMETVGLTKDLVTRFPHEMDGGRCQRIGIARALALNPDFIVCDEPVSALDVSIQAQILNLLQDMQERRGLTYLFISHNLAVVKHISSSIVVMYLGKVMEVAKTAELFANPLHPYTKALLQAIPNPSLENREEKAIIAGDVPTPVNPPPGCRFVKRCSLACQRCAQETPRLVDLGREHLVACHRPDAEFGGAVI